MATLRALREHQASSACIVQLVGTPSHGRGNKGARVRAEILKQSQAFSTSDIEQACPGVSRDMVRLVLRAMKGEGLIAPMGKGRGAQWIRLGNMDS